MLPVHCFANLVLMAYLVEYHTCGDQMGRYRNEQAQKKQTNKQASKCKSKYTKSVVCHHSFLVDVMGSITHRYTATHAAGHDRESRESREIMEQTTRASSGLCA